MNRRKTQSPNWPPAIKRAVRTIDRFGMFSPGEKVLVGVSGGPDSTALLHILVQLTRRYKLTLGVAHLNHGLRPVRADQDEAFVAQLAGDLKLPLFRHGETLCPESGSVEEQAREARYRFFKAVMQDYGYAKIALGHQKNDNAEAVLMHLLRGSGIRGLAGIPPIRDNEVVRPLIDLDRSEIIDYLEDHRIPFVEDETNKDLVYERNRIRHHLIPIIREAYNPNIIDTLHRTADVCREEDIWFERHIGPLLDRIVPRSERQRLEIHHSPLAKANLAIQRRLIRGALSNWQGHLRRLGAHHIDAVLGLLSADAEGKKISLPNGIEAIRTPSHLQFVQRDADNAVETNKKSDFCHTISHIDCLPLAVDIPAYGCRIRFDVDVSIQEARLPSGDENTAWFDLEELTFPLQIRSFKPGDRISPYGMQGTQKIKKLFIDRKIPAARRHQIPLLESHGAVVWVAGIRRSKLAMVSDHTKRVLRVKFDIGAGAPQNHG